jgi:hypothetical protein
VTKVVVTKPTIHVKNYTNVSGGLISNKTKHTQNASSNFNKSTGVNTTTVVHHYNNTKVYAYRVVHTQQVTVNPNGTTTTKTIKKIVPVTPNKKPTPVPTKPKVPKLVPKPCNGPECGAVPPPLLLKGNKAKK